MDSQDPDDGTDDIIDTSLAHLYNHTGSGTEITTGVNKDGQKDGIGTFELTDIRDTKTYLVRRLADGNCWMVQNLDLELADYIGKDGTNGGLTRENTDLNTVGKAYWDPAASTLAKAQTFNQTADLTNYFSIASLNLLGTNQGENQFQSKSASGATYHWGSKYYDVDGVKTLGNAVRNNVYAEIPRSYDNEADWVDNSASNADSSGAKYKSTGSPNNASEYVGDYYNWYAVTAESGRLNMESGHASDSICPFGWLLPISSSSNKSYGKLLNSYSIVNSKTGSRMLRSFPLSLIATGVYSWDGGVTSSRGLNGFLATASPSSTTHNYYLDFDSSNVVPAYIAQKLRGYTIRCVNRGTENQVTPPEDVVQSTCAANSICYDANGGTGDTMANTSSATFGSSKVLSAPTFTRTGYAFVGWSESKDAVQSGAYIYGPNETITVPNLSSEGMTLYAQWLAPENSSYTMQAFGRNETVKTCANMTDGNNGTTEERIALRDERDDNVYIVTKLKDGNCWMTSNLALNLADFAGKTTGTLLTPENTDLTASREDLSTLTIEGVGNEQQTVKYWDPSASTVKKYTETYASELQSRGLTQDFTGLSTLLIGQTQSDQFQSGSQTSYAWGTRVSDDGNWTAGDSVTHNTNEQIPRSYNIENVGFVYNYYAVSAEASKLNAQPQNYDNPDSICPKGWQLPVKDSENKSWANLLIGRYGLVEGTYSDALLASPLNLPLTRASYGWRAGGIGNPYFATRFESSAGSGDMNYGRSSGEFHASNYVIAKANGRMIRCVKRD